MNEVEPFAHLNIGGERFGMSRENTTLYDHLGKLALFNHLFVTLGESKGLYLWKHHEQFEELAALAIKNLCVTHLNLSEVSPVDMKAYIKHSTADLGDTVPEDWS